MGCASWRSQGRPAVCFDVLVSAAAAVAVLWFELRRLGQFIGDGREGVLPQPGIDVLLPDSLLYGSLVGRRPASFQRDLAGHEKRAGRHEQNPDEAVASNVR